MVLVVRLSPLQSPLFLPKAQESFQRNRDAHAKDFPLKQTRDKSNRKQMWKGGDIIIANSGYGGGN